jgi:hypothetical protein
MTSLAEGFPFIQRFALRNDLLGGREWIRHSAGRFDLIAWHPRAHDSLVSPPVSLSAIRRAPTTSEAIDTILTRLVMAKDPSWTK